MAVDPTQDPNFINDDIFNGFKNPGGGGGTPWQGGGTGPNPVSLFGFGLGGSPGFLSGTNTGLRRRFAVPVTAASQRNRFAQPANTVPMGGRTAMPTGALNPWSGGQSQQGGNNNIYGQPMGPGFIQNMFDQNAQGANGLDFALLGALGQAGGFDPLGSPALIQALRQQAMQSSQANEASSRTQAMLNAGNDPLMQAQAALGSRLGGASDQNRALLAARAQSALQNQQFLQALSQMLFAGERGLGQQKELSRFQQDIQGSPGLGDFLGGLIGTGLGGWAGAGFPLGGNRQVSG